MSSGGLLLLLGLLTLWAELTPVSGQGRPDFCHLPAVTGPCKAHRPRFYYNSTFNNCQEFIYGGCRGNANRFKTRDECHYTCVEKPGVCPKPPPDTVTICLVRCGSDWECEGKQKCCPYACLVDCMHPVFLSDSPFDFSELCLVPRLGLKAD
ncbi:kunitz-type serine protease inhibitor 4-like [Thamnophis elegans]|uniref:kunitz-type serine protease inhibitor 4-like n=1 Tax=Thamnophis elegans TaxID=35005 RepID=UPI001377509E|nr:kunitz-type serine protease inhibitor 4-like [Thamnophis elegans]